jgi:hypothetical protein
VKEDKYILRHPRRRVYQEKGKTPGEAKHFQVPVAASLSPTPHFFPGFAHLLIARAAV